MVEFRKVPVPEDIQIIFAKLAAVAPVTVKLLPAHIVASGPAYATDVLTIVNTMASIIVLVHGGKLKAVSVRVTDPFAMSVALGVYVGLSVVVLIKLPVPELVHCRLE